VTAKAIANRLRVNAASKACWCRVRRRKRRYGMLGPGLRLPFCCIAEFVSLFL
jgi:hypothetical protein